MTRFGGGAAVWDVRTGDRLAVLKEVAGWIADVSWSPDGTRLVTAGSDGAVRVWDARTGADLLTLDGPTEPITSVSWSPGG